MDRRLSHERIESFQGDVLPLYIVSEEDLSKADVSWTVENEDIVILHTFKSDDPQSVAHCALLTLTGVGETVVSAQLDGKTYTCSVSVREMRRAKAEDTLNYYAGDLHDHTSDIHNHATFAERTSGFVIDYLKNVKEDGKLDLTVVSDHAVTTNDRDFFSGFSGVEEIQPCPVVFFPGTESEVTVVEKDRYGVPYKNAGEIVTVNSGSYVNAYSWEEFFEAMERSPYAVCVLAHPYAVGFSVKGCWNFSLHKNNSQRFKELIKGVEMGDGGVRHANGIHEYVYSLALDNGFFVSTTCSSDCHGPKWGYNACPGKTMVMAYEKSKEAFLDALMARRFYASESANIKLSYAVNGISAPATLPLANKYDFHVDLSYFRDDPATYPTSCRVISDYGKIVAEFDNIDPHGFDFTVESDTARYFYLRFTDSNGQRTWSPPVFTSRAIDGPKPPLTPIDKTGFTVTELESGKDASVLVDDDPFTNWESEFGAATYLIDMKEEKMISALGHYTPYTERSKLKERAVISQKIVNELGRERRPEVPTAISRFVGRYQILVSCDGENFTLCDEGSVRCFSGEELLRFTPCKARYVKFKVLTTTGKEWRSSFDDLTLNIAELSLFE